MELLKQIQEELQEIEKIKKENICLKADKKRMSQALYELMLEKYKSQSYEERVEIYKNDSCNCCRGGCYGCNIVLPQNILEPVNSTDWIPGIKGCKNFEWS